MSDETRLHGLHATGFGKYVFGVPFICTACRVKRKRWENLDHSLIHLLEKLIGKLQSGDRGNKANNPRVLETGHPR